MRKTNPAVSGSWLVANPSELAIASAWAKAKFTATQPKAVSFAQVKILKQGYAQPWFNRSMVGTPLTIGREVLSSAMARPSSSPEPPR